VEARSAVGVGRNSVDTEGDQRSGHCVEERMNRRLMEVGCHGVVSEKASYFLSMYQIYQKKQEKHCLLLFLMIGCIESQMLILIELNICNK
jgi:hypothetical protein